MTRRSFLGSASAFVAVSGFASADKMLGGRLNLRFGVLSDTHITNWESADTFRRALRFYREADVDAVMICGDMTNMGVLCNLETVAKCWYEVFPGDKGQNGKHVEKLFIYGNHDAEPSEYGIGNVGLAKSLMHCPGYKTEEVRRQRLDLVGLGKAWESCFHEPFEPIYRKTVRGYDFIGAHWDTQARVRGLEEWFGKHGSSLDPSKPFFYFQHPHPQGTVNTSGPFSHDDGTSTRILSHYPNAVVFSGHSHTTLTDDRTLWRGSFTSIGASTLSERGAEPNMLVENLFASRDPALPARQGMLVSVYDDRLVLDRRDFFFNEPIDEPWIVPLPAMAENRVERMAKARAPQFADDARVYLIFGKCGEDGSVRFPPAVAEPSARPFDYEVTVDYRHGEDIVARRMFRAYGPTVLQPKSHDLDVKRVTLTVPAGCMPKYDIGEARVTVVPHNSLGVAGRPIATGWVRVPKE